MGLLKCLGQYDRDFRVWGVKILFVCHDVKGSSWRVLKKESREGGGKGVDIPAGRWRSY